MNILRSICTLNFGFSSGKTLCSTIRRNSTFELPEKYTARRAVMYIPGDDEKKLRKIPALNPDCAVLECEDGVALNKKDVARQTIKQMLGEMDFGRSEVCVRINSLQSGLGEADLDAILQAKRLPSTILLPKVHSPSDVEWFAEQMKKHLDQRRIVDKVNLIVYIESALGLLSIKDICQKAKLLSQHFPFKLDGLVFGADDYIADTGAIRTQRNKEVMVPRQMVVACAKAFGLQAIDMVYIDYKDVEGLKRQCLEGAEWGFTGQGQVGQGGHQAVPGAPDSRKGCFHFKRHHGGSSFAAAGAEHSAAGRIHWRPTLNIKALLQAPKDVTLDGVEPANYYFQQ